MKKQKSIKRISVSMLFGTYNYDLPPKDQKSDIRHSKEKDDVFRLPALNKSTAFRYTGESDFAGVRSHAKNRSNPMIFRQ